MKKLIVIAVLLVGLSAWAQDKPAVPELTTEEALQLSVLVKDVQLADKDVQLARMQFLNLSQMLQARQLTMNNEIARLRLEHNLPEGAFLFNAQTLKFEPVPEKKE